MRARPFVTVVSGLPRSGTSLAMQMLAAGGLPLLADAQRPPDADNPRGYLEYAPVKRLAEDASWVPEARGRAVKVVAPLLRHLPAGPAYRVLLARRPLDQVMASQRRMLARRGTPDPGSQAELAALFARELAAAEALARRPGFALLALDYPAVLADPGGAARAIDVFLGGGLDRAAMAGVVDPALCHAAGDAGEPAEAASG